MTLTFLDQYINFIVDNGAIGVTILGELCNKLSLKPRKSTFHQHKPSFAEFSRPSNRAFPYNQTLKCKEN